MHERYRAVWRLGLEGPLNYYRASPLRPPLSGEDAIHGLALAPESVEERLPTTVLWGADDDALLPTLLDGLDAHVAQLRVQRVPGAPHWLIHERPVLVAGAIERALG